MTRPSRPELFAQRPVRSDFGNRPGPVVNLRRLFLLIALIVLAVGIGVGVNALIGDEEQTNEEVPVIKAEGGPLKERPEQPGGLDVPHQDVTVFEKLESGAEKPDKPVMENLLPPPDTPQPVPEPEKAAETVPPDAPVVAPSPAPFAEAAESLPPPITAAETKEPEKLIEDSKPVLQNLPKEVKEEPKKEASAKVEKVVSKPKAETKKAEESVGRLPKELFTTGEVPTAAKLAAEKEALPKNEGKTARVQLASLPDQATAQSEAKRFQNKYAAFLGGAALTVIRADLGAKGIFYRVMSAPLPETKAKAICADLAKQKASCLVVR